MKRIKKLSLLLLSILVISGCAQPSGSMQSTLRGVVIDRPESDMLILVRLGDDERFHSVHIPIIDGKFEYVFDFEHEEQFRLLFNDERQRGSMMPIQFFMEQGVIYFTLHPMERFDENIVEGGALNKALQSFTLQSNREVNYLWAVLNEKNRRLIEEGQYFTPEAQMLLDRRNESSDEEERAALLDKFNRLYREGNLHLTQTARMFADSIHQEVNLVDLRHIRENPTLVGYSFLFSQVGSLLQENTFFGATHDISPFTELYRTVFAPKFPDHPYTERMEMLLAGAAIQAGIPFVDFTAVDLNGNPVTLSERIAGKPTILNLWASWCGPCRRKGRALIPLYEEFRDKGLVVIGVARETSIANAEAAIRVDGYPWENLVELNDVGQIWNKYGIGNAGGMVFLIDENGIIYASNPSIEEVREFLVGRVGGQ